MAKIKIENALYQKLKDLAATAGYSSPDEFIIHLLEQSVADRERDTDQESVKERLTGLGYLG